MSSLKTAFFPFALLLFALAGCGGMTDRPDPTPSPPSTLTVMTYNVYVGSSTETLLGTTDLTQIPLRAAEAYSTVLASDFSGRAAAIAKIIKASQPHLIGLQEISRLRTQDPADSLVNPVPNAETVVLDFLEVLMGALQTEGLEYAVAGQVVNFDLEIPMISGGGLVDVRLTDSDVILARSGVATANAMSATYQTKLPIPRFGTKVPRGYVAVDATVDGATYRVVNTHLESFEQQVRIAQAQELVDSLSAESPVILLGDFNTQAVDGAAYQLLIGAGYSDVWQADSEGDGYTCCQAPDLGNVQSTLDKRIDQVFIKGVVLRQGASIRTATVGAAPADRTPSGLWPSDHAGVVVHLPVE